MSRGAGNGLGAPQSLSRASSTPMPRQTPLRGPCGRLSAFVSLRGMGAGSPKAQAPCPEKQDATSADLVGYVKGSQAQGRCAAPTVTGPYSLIHVNNCGNPHAYWAGGPNRFF